MSLWEGSINTDVTAIKAKTDNLPTDPADASVVAGNVTTAHSTTDALVTSESITQPKIVERATQEVPNNTQAGIFTVSGRVLVTQIVGEVTQAMGGNATDLKLIANPTVGADVDLCTAVTVTSDTIGTLYNITGAFADAMVATVSGAFESQSNAIMIAAGTLDIHTAGTTETGQVKWTVHYIPLDASSTLTAVAI